MRRKPKLPPGAPPWAVGYDRHGEDGVPEWICEHGVGHGGVHTCDGCCVPARRGPLVGEAETEP